MRLLKKLIPVLAICLMLPACMNFRSFVDPDFPAASYESVTRLAAPASVAVAVQFQRNGAPLPRGDAELRDIVERTLRGSGVITPGQGSDGEIRVTVNNVADLGEAAAKGFGSGLTFGAVGTIVTDRYEMSVTITRDGRTVSRSGVRHALHSTIGNVTLPAHLETTTPTGAFQRVVESMLLSVLADMQRTGDLPGGTPAPRVASRQ